MSTLIEDGAVVLFQGDSITDCGRSRSDDGDLGNGYASMIAAWFNAVYPEKRVRFINRGISGNRVRDLVERWQRDCIDLNPSWVSILIGINDCWRRYDSNDPTPVEVFAAGYRRILTEVCEKLHAKIIICEPFVLPVPEDRKMWREDLDPKIHVVRELAREFGALYVPLDGIFASAAAKREPEFWAPDGVHPSRAGHALIARAWLQTVKAEL
ncbi:lysophospholipase L1-like esterase [Caldicoprobacter guelmensis]|uniref:SGNH/GDSL hydrolase family protein n=1 Tax=Caldicoprobacter guelmensis TaxID=1170224 RepID=UPI00195D5B33|nr:SGNH/GDSL hydrolase family protein [Caldicoprobacter guelmensis]MBM7581743.1 lysophospholipase L1-like esterase [Caldicoprobacter guelmensis]